jgi:hypothetical protein
MKLEFSRHIFEKYTSIEFNENPFSGDRVVPCGWTDECVDRYDEVISRFLKVCERA